MTAFPVLASLGTSVQIFMPGLDILPQLLAKFKLPARTVNKTCLNSQQYYRNKAHLMTVRLTNKHFNVQIFLVYSPQEDDPEDIRKSFYHNVLYKFRQLM